jgi:methionyl-tRNA formyltransferase
MTMKLIFAGTPDFAAVHLQALIDSEHEIKAVYTQPDRPKGRGRQLAASPVKTLALAHDLPVCQPVSLKSVETQETLAAFDADLMVVVAYGLILPQVILDTPKLGCVNVHASLLPRFRGAAPIQHAILAGDTETGVTIMKMAAGLDTGDMLYKVTTPIGDSDTGSSLHDRLAEGGAKALIYALSQFETLEPEVQDDALSTYAHKLTKAQAMIDWRVSAIEIDRQIRAYNSWPVAFFNWQDQPVRVWSASVATNQQADTPGEVLQIDASGIRVATGDGVICLETLQLPSKRALPVKDLLNGQALTFQVGDSL